MTLGSVTALAVSATSLRAQEIGARLMWHVSLNAGDGRSADLPTLGIPIKGTSDDRLFTQQSRRALSEKDEFLPQSLNRKFGERALATAGVKVLKLK
jgi:hypothetical protein